MSITFIDYLIEAKHIGYNPEFVFANKQVFDADIAINPNDEQAQKIINQLMTNNDTSSAGSPAYFLGWYYSGIQDLDSAFYWLEKAYQNHSPEFSWYKVDPIFNLNVPQSCPGVPKRILNPYNSWRDEERYLKETERNH